MTEEKIQDSSADTDDSQDDSQEDEVDESQKNQNQDGSLSSEEQKELEELRQKSELKKNIELLDEEYARKTKRNVKIINQDQENNQEEPTEMDKFLLEEREGALEDFMASHKDYNNTDKRDELLAEVKSFRDIEKAGYRSYTQLLNKAHRILGGDSLPKNNRDNIKKINESIASSNASGVRSKFSDNEIQLTKEQKNIIKKIPGMTEKRYIEQLKKDRAQK